MTNDLIKEYVHSIMNLMKHKKAVLVPAICQQPVLSGVINTLQPYLQVY